MLLSVLSVLSMLSVERILLGILMVRTLRRQIPVNTSIAVNTTTGRRKSSIASPITAVVRRRVGRGVGVARSLETGSADRELLPLLLWGLLVWVELLSGLTAVSSLTYPAVGTQHALLTALLLPWMAHSRLLLSCVLLIRHVLLLRADRLSLLLTWSSIL